VEASPTQIEGDPTDKRVFSGGELTQVDDAGDRRGERLNDPRLQMRAAEDHHRASYVFETPESNPCALDSIL
jgi:hypothetical protein